MIFTKQSDDFFCFKGDCGANLRKQNRIIFLALTKAEGSVAYAYCQCLAGRVEPKACTSKPCAWSIPQSGERLEKSSISRLKIFSPTITKSKINTYSKGGTISNTRSTNTSSTTISYKNITSFFYDSRTKTKQKNGTRKEQGPNFKSC